MENLTKYIMGVAAKSNVEKRKVGCIIVNDQEKIVAEGYNMATPGEEDVHAEIAACEHMCAQALDIGEDFWYTAYVTHPPCPDCAKTLTEYGVKEVIIVEAFMKFDGDKPRIDLIDPQFALLALKFTNWNQPFPDKREVKEALYRWSIAPNETVAAGVVDEWRRLLTLTLGQYQDFYDFERSLAAVLTFGARKYKPGNWKECTDTGRYLAAAHRHLNALEQNDEETGLPHRDHMLCNLMFLYHLGLK